MLRRGLVDFSRTMGTGSLATLAAVSCLAISGFAVLSRVLVVADDRSVRLLLSSTVVLIPVLLCMLVQVSRVRGGGSFYDVARRSGKPLPLFLVGWLCLGGYLLVAALMVEAIGTRTQSLIEQSFGVILPLFWLVGPITVLAGATEIVIPSERTRMRALFGGFAVAVLIGLLVWTSIAARGVDSGDYQLPIVEMRHRLAGIALPAAGLWFLEMVLECRRQFRRSDRVMAMVTVGTWALTGLLLAWTAMVILEAPLFFGRLTGEVDTSPGGVQRRLIMTLLAFVVCGTTLAKALARMMRLAGAMSIDGMLPAFFEGETGGSCAHRSGIRTLRTDGPGDDHGGICRPRSTGGNRSGPVPVGGRPGALGRLEVRSRGSSVRPQVARRTLAAIGRDHRLHHPLDHGPTGRPDRQSLLGAAGPLRIRVARPQDGDRGGR